MQPFSIPSLSHLTSVLVVGLGREGLSTVSFLHKHAPHLEITVADAVAKLPPDQQSQLPAGVKVLLGENYLNSLNDFPLTIKSAGVSPFSPIWDTYIKQGGKITSNTELFFEWASLQPHLKTIGVTGTKGKSTTTSLIFHVLKENGVSSVMGGNVGIPCLNLVPQLEPLLPQASTHNSVYAVLELSSHQTKDLKFSPSITVLQAFTPEHLDYYPSLESYYQAKADLLAHLTPDHILIARYDNDQTRQLSTASPATTIWFGLDIPTQEPPHVLIAPQGLLSGNTTVSTASLHLTGDHNIINATPSLIIGRLLGLPDQAITKAWETFTPLAHRLEPVANFKGVQFINDSAGTTPEACIAALATFAEHPIILLAGGSDKGVSFAELAQALIATPPKHLLLFPTTGQQIEAEIAKLDPQNSLLANISHVENMEAAFAIIQERMKLGDVVLLSPACASFGVFKNYQDRGDQFRAWAQKIASSGANSPQ